MELNKIFTSHMVFQARKPIRVYGKGQGKAEIKFAGQKSTVVSDKDDWMAELEPMEYGGPYSMEIFFEDSKIVLEDIYIGEVYLFSGQSNMEMKMKSTNTPPELYKSNNKLRFYSTDKIVRPDYYTTSDGWVICEKECIEKWSALAYLAGDEISRTKDIAVGIIVCCLGESVIESWVPEGSFQKIGINIPDEDKFENHSISFNKEGTLYNFALSQAIPYSISAVVWYQGESDATEAEGYVYAEELCELIRIWRKDFLDDNLPFIVIQIADFVKRAELAWKDNGWPLIQKAQIEVPSKIHGVKTVISCDVCENDEIHPQTKDKLSKRISANLLDLI